MQIVSHFKDIRDKKLLLKKRPHMAAVADIISNFNKNEWCTDYPVPNQHSHISVAFFSAVGIVVAKFTLNLLHKYVPLGTSLYVDSVCE